LSLKARTAGVLYKSAGILRTMSTETKTPGGCQGSILRVRRGKTGCLMQHYLEEFNTSWHRSTSSRSNHHCEATIEIHPRCIQTWPILSGTGSSTR
jgi:hypothetical protein